MKFFTLGYGGRKPHELLDILRTAGVKTLVDVRLVPQRAYLGVFSRQKNPASGIEGLLGREGIAYLSLETLGNPFREHEDWRDRFARHLEEGGPELIAPLREVAPPFALLCAEKKVGECHREQIAAFVLRAWPGSEVEHL
jgi:uncharacterized protein (DUF488 family)